MNWAEPNGLVQFPLVSSGLPFLPWVALGSPTDNLPSRVFVSCGVYKYLFSFSSFFTVMSSLSILEEFAREFVHEQSFLSELLLLLEAQARAVATSQCCHVGDLLQVLHHQLSDL